MYGAVGALGYLLLLGFGEKGKLRYSDKHRKLCAHWYQNTWRGIYHPEDEAISTLRDIHGLRGTIFPTNFLVGAFSILPVIIVPVGILLISWQNGGVIFNFGSQLSPLLVTRAAVFVLLNIIANFLVVTLLVLAFRGAGYLFGMSLAPAINTSIWSQIKRAAWGDDLVGEYVQAVEPVPNGFDCQPIALPENAVKALSAFTDQHSTESVRKARNILALASQTGESADLIHQISAALSWNELVHTAYFVNEEFIKFVALVLHDAGVAPLRQSD